MSSSVLDSESSLLGHSLGVYESSSVTLMLQKKRTKENSLSVALLKVDRERGKKPGY